MKSVCKEYSSCYVHNPQCFPKFAKSASRESPAPAPLEAVTRGGGGGGGGAAAVGAEGAAADDGAALELAPPNDGHEDFFPSPPRTASAFDASRARSSSARLIVGAGAAGRSSTRSSARSAVCCSALAAASAESPALLPLPKKRFSSRPNFFTGARGRIVMAEWVAPSAFPVLKLSFSCSRMARPLAVSSSVTPCVQWVCGQTLACMQANRGSSEPRQ